MGRTHILARRYTKELTALIRRPRLDMKVQMLCASLRKLAFEAGPGTRLPTVRELCDTFNTNPGTLSDALKELESQNVIYRKPGSGIFVSPKLHRKSVCVLFYSHLFIGRNISPYWGMLWTIFAREMEMRTASGSYYYSFHLVLSPPDGEVGMEPKLLLLPEDVIEMIHEQRVHGIMAVGMQMHAFEWLTKMGIPSVTLAGLGTSMVEGAYEENVKLAVASLKEQGCRSIGLWLSNDTLANGDENPIYGLFQTHLAAYELDFHPESIVIGPGDLSNPPQEWYSRQEQGYRVALQVFDQQETYKPDGIYINDDMMTSGAIFALTRKLGIRIGEEVKVVTNANAGSPTLFGEADYLTLLEYDPVDSVQAMFTLMDQLLLGEPAEYIVQIKPKLRKPSHMA